MLSGSGSVSTINSRACGSAMLPPSWSWPVFPRAKSGPNPTGRPSVNGGCRKFLLFTALRGFGLISCFGNGGRIGEMAEGRLKHFGWGREGEGMTAAEEAAGLDRYRRLFGVNDFDEKSPPALGEIQLRQPRLTPSGAIASFCSTDAYDRIAHTYGKSFRDYARGMLGEYGPAPDVVAYPRNESEVASLIDW